jgi:hypothetical protein
MGDGRVQPPKKAAKIIAESDRRRSIGGVVAQLSRLGLGEVLEVRGTRQSSFPLAKRG